MKRLVLTIMIISYMITPAYCMDFWHSKTLGANQGQCVAVFSFDSFMEDIDQIQLTVTALDKTGKKVTSGLIEIEHLGSGALRYADAVLEGDGLCQDNLSIVVKKATAMLNGKKIDLLKAKKITARDFKPYKIRIGK